MEPRAHQGQSDGCGDALWSLVLDGAVEVDGADPVIATAGGEQFAGELVIRLVLGNRFPDPAVIGLGGVGPNLDGELRLDSENVAPFHGPVIEVRGLVQETVDQGDAFVGIRALDEGLGLIGRGKFAQDVEIGTTNEHGIGAEGGLDSHRLQFGKDRLVDSVGGFWFLRALHKACHSPGSDEAVPGGLGLLGQGAFFVSDVDGSQVGGASLFCFLLQGSGDGLRLLGSFFVGHVRFFGRGRSAS